jgi:hypothetical protein
MANQPRQTTPATLKLHNRLLGTSPFELDIDRVIRGLKFSTTTSTLACVIACSGVSQLADFHFERTGLYLSPRGQWFLAGEGGAASHWGRRSIDGAVARPATACSSSPRPKRAGSWSSTTARSKRSSNPRKADR